MRIHSSQVLQVISIYMTDKLYKAYIFFLWFILQNKSLIFLIFVDSFLSVFLLYSALIPFYNFTHSSHRWSQWEVLTPSFTHQCRITVSYPEILTVETEIACKSRLALLMATRTEGHAQYLGNHPLLKVFAFSLLMLLVVNTVLCFSVSNAAQL